MLDHRASVDNLDKDVRTSQASRCPDATPAGSQGQFAGPKAVVEHANTLREPQTWERQRHEPQDKPRSLQHMHSASSPSQRLAPPKLPLQAVQQEQVQQHLRPNRSLAEDRPLRSHKQDAGRCSSHDSQRDSSARSSCGIAVSPDESVEDALQLQRRCDATEDVVPPASLARSGRAQPGLADSNLPQRSATRVPHRQSSPSRTSGSRSRSAPSDGSHSRSRSADSESGKEGWRGPRSGRREALPSRRRRESPAQPARFASGSEGSGPRQSHHAGFVPGSDGSGYHPRAADSDGMSHESFHESVDEVFSDE